MSERRRLIQESFYEDLVPTHRIVEGAQMKVLSKKMHWVLVVTRQEGESHRDEGLVERLPRHILARDMVVYHPSYRSTWTVHTGEPVGVASRYTRAIK